MSGSEVPVSAVSCATDHDPLCRASSGTFCDCPLIARVREDERTNEPPAWAYANGYAAALRDAVEAVRLSPSADIELVERSQVLDAIEALGVER